MNGPWVPFTQGCYVPSLVEISPVVVMIFKLGKCIPLFCYYFDPLGKGHYPSFEKNWIPTTQGCSVSRLVEIGPVVLEKIFKFQHCICYFVIISPWKRAWPFIWTNLNPNNPRMLCTKFSWNWPSCSGEDF